MMKKSLFLICFVLLGFLAFSQNMSVSSFRYLENDLSGSYANVEDVNNQICALIKVSLPLSGVEFTGTGLESYEQKTGEYWVFVSPGMKFITIKHRDFHPIRSYAFPQQIKSARTYEMVITTDKITQTIEESITDQYLIIESSTPEAKIFINNEFAGRNSAVKLLSIFEEHSYRVEAPLYYTKSGSVKLTSEQKAILNIDLDTAFGYLKVNTSPVGGAEIEINGKLQEGKTPFFSQKLESGNYKVQAFMPMYKSELQEVDIYDGKTSEITINLIPTFANVEITCQDKDAEIYIDGKYKAKGGFKGQLNEGAYQLEVKKQSHRAIKKIINAISGQNLIENIDKLQAINGKLNLNSTPYGAKIFIDHKPYGETPIVIPEILVGKHELRLEKNGYHTLYEQINIEEGKIAKYDLVLKEKPTSQPVLEPKREEKEEKYSTPTKWELYLGTGYVADMGGNDSFSDSGINAEFKLTYRPGGFVGVGFFASAEMLYTSANGNAKTHYQQMAYEYVANNSYDYCKITLPHYYDFPIMLGVNYNLSFPGQFSIFAQGGVGLNISKATNQTHTYTIGGETSKETITNSIKTGVAYQAGLGVKLFNTLILGVNYYHFNYPKANKLILKLGFNF